MDDIWDSYKVDEEFGRIYTPPKTKLSLPIEKQTQICSICSSGTIIQRKKCCVCQEVPPLPLRYVLVAIHLSNPKIL